MPFSTGRAIIPAQSTRHEETAMLKLLFGLPILIMLMLGSVLMLPLLGLATGVFGIMLAIAVLALVLRLMAFVVVGVGGLLFGAFCLAFLFAGGAIFLALAGALLHLAFPILFIVAIVWLVRRASRPAPPAAISHG